MVQSEQSQPRRTSLMVFAWAWVGVPFTYGAFELVRKVIQLFGA